MKNFRLRANVSVAVLLTGISVQSAQMSCKDTQRLAAAHGVLAVVERVVRWSAEHQLMGYGPVAYSPNGKYLATGSAYGTIMIWNAKTGVMECASLGQRCGSCAVVYSPDGRADSG